MLEIFLVDCDLVGLIYKYVYICLVEFLECVNVEGFFVIWQVECIVLAKDFVIEIGLEFLEFQLFFKWEEVGVYYCL